MPATSVFVQLRRRESSSPIQAHLRMQSFDAAELDCNAALKIDKRMTKALFRCGLILQHLGIPFMRCKAFLRRGKARSALSNRNGAIEDFKKVLPRSFILTRA